MYVCMQDGCKDSRKWAVRVFFLLVCESEMVGGRGVAAQASSSALPVASSETVAFSFPVCKIG